MADRTIDTVFPEFETFWNWWYGRSDHENEYGNLSSMTLTQTATQGGLAQLDHLQEEIKEEDEEDSSRLSASQNSGKINDHEFNGAEEI
jgi:hypothetical protein